MLHLPFGFAMLVIQEFRRSIFDSFEHNVAVADTRLIEFS
jgi:hypothetical protein